MDFKNIIYNITKIEIDTVKMYKECLVNVGLSAEEILLIIMKISEVSGVKLSSFMTKINRCSLEEIENIVKEEANEENNPYYWWWNQI